jgi:hypothetical protein
MGTLVILNWPTQGNNDAGMVIKGGPVVPGEFTGYLTAAAAAALSRAWALMQRGTTRHVSAK